MSLVRYSPKLRARILAGEVIPWLEKHTRKRYIVTVTLSRPPWVKTSAFASLERRRAWLERLTGKPHVLDHIVPVNHPYVCGLTVPWNMQVTTRRANAAKSNHWCEWHGDLFDEPEQFKLL